MRNILPFMLSTIQAIYAGTDRNVMSYFFGQLR